MDMQKLVDLLRPMVFRTFGRTSDIDVQEYHVTFTYSTSRDEVFANLPDLNKLSATLKKHNLSLSLSSDATNKVGISVWVDQ